jgi:hypothetical protein
MTHTVQSSRAKQKPAMLRQVVPLGLQVAALGLQVFPQRAPPALGLQVFLQHSPHQLVYQI